MERPGRASGNTWDLPRARKRGGQGIEASACKGGGQGIEARACQHGGQGVADRKEENNLVRVMHGTCLGRQLCWRTLNPKP